MSDKIELLIIDPQNDFCDPKGSLYVPGADQDMTRLAAFIDRMRADLDDIHVTLDSHRRVDIAHPIYWKNSDDKHPPPFIFITPADVAAAKWAPVDPRLQARAQEYVETLAKNGRYDLCIWPEHCRIGSWGHQVFTPVLEALWAWEEQFALTDFVTKGSNLHTEHYSAVQAEVPDPKDPGTQLNTKLCDTLLEADVVLIAGEAGSHCVANTVRDIANAFGDDKYVRKLVLLTDAVSAVPLPAPFDTLQADFIKEMIGRGMKTSTTVEYGL